MGRSAARQVSHWARLGRDLEALGGAALPRIAAVLAGDARCDDLGDAGAREIVRAVWAELMKQRREGLDIGAEFAAGGRPYAERAARADRGPVARSAASAGLFGGCSADVGVVVGDAASCSSTPPGVSGWNAAMAASVCGRLPAGAFSAMGAIACSVR